MQGWSRESDLHPIIPNTPAPQYQPKGRKKRNGKIVEYNSRDRAYYTNAKIIGPACNQRVTHIEYSVSKIVLEGHR